MEVCTYPHDGMTFRAYAAVAALPVAYKLVIDPLDVTKQLPSAAELAKLTIDTAVLLAELLAEKLHNN
jgi:hypothetical protein